MGHNVDNCLCLQKQKAFLSCQESIQEWVKLKAPNSKGQGKSAKVDPLATSIPIDRFEGIIHTLSSSAVYSETKQKVMQRVVLQCPAVPIDLLGQKGTIIA